MTGYADYFPELPGGSATGRAMEPKPFDVRRLGADRARLRPPALAAPFPMPAPLLAERSLPGQIIVNQQGRRFMNEAVNYMTAGQILIQQQLPVWMVFDQRYRNRHVFGGGVFPRQALPAAWYDAGIAAKADTLADLAEQLGLTDLPATVERFNVQASAGRDDDFHRGDSAYDRYYGDPTIKPNPCLGPTDRGPFYAVKVVPGDLGTCGGMRADGLGRALRSDGSIIEGLYAAGRLRGSGKHPAGSFSRTPWSE
jgi:hypothetical protein